MLLRQGILPIILLCLLLFTSCNHKEIYHEDFARHRVYIHFDYKQVEKEASSVRVLFYPLEGISKSPFVFDLDGNGGIVPIPNGKYHILAYNVDTENIIELEENNIDAFELTTPSYEVEEGVMESDNAQAARLLAGQMLPKGDGEGSFLQYDIPDYTMRSRYNNFKFEYHGEQYSDISLEDIAAEVTLLMEPAVYKVNLVIKGLIGMERLTYARGTLSGVASSYYMGEGVPSEKAGLVVFHAQPYPADSVMRASFYVWAPYPKGNENVRQFLNLYYWALGANFYSSTELTDALRNANYGPSGMTLNVELTTDIDMTQGTYEGGNSGFQPNVDDWGNENHNIHF